MDHGEACESCRVVQKVRVILASNRPPFEKVRAVELAIQPPRSPYRKPQLGPKGWPVLQGSTAWEMHDDPERS